jgi:hypothetical protein
MSTDSVLEVNPSYGLREADPMDGIDGFLCVVRDNNPTKGDFYSAVTTPQQVSILDTSNVKRAYSFVKTRVTAEGYTQNGYVAGNRMQAAFANQVATEKGFAAYGGFMPLPTAGVNGQCTTQNPMRFQNAVTENKCMKTTSLGNTAAMKAQCQDMSWPTANIYLAKTFSTTMSVGITSNTDQYTPVVSERTSSSGNGAFWDDSTETCVNALASVHYRVTYSPRTTTAATEEGGDPVQSGGTIDSIVANVVVTNLTSIGSGNNQYLSIQQEYLVDFIQAGVIRPRARSGMPGYIDGRPVLAGTLVANGATGADTPKQAIQQTVDGLRIPFFSNNQGQCISSLMKADDLESSYGESVFFRHEFMKACSIPITLAQLKVMCEKDPDTVTTADAPYGSTYGIYLNSTGIPGKIGVYGNANWTNIDTTEWLDLTIVKPVGKGTFNDNLLICNTLVTSMNIEILYANAGAYLNPQPKIVAARVSFGREDINFISNGSPATESMNLVLSTSVTFVHLGDEALEEYVPPAPPLLPEIPYDIFYPFLLSDGTRHSSPLFFVSLMMLLCASLLR